MFKLDLNGNGQLIRKEDITRSKNLKDFTFEQFQQICMLSGCDYLKYIKGIGLQRAKLLVKEGKTIGLESAVLNCKEILKVRSIALPTGYWENFLAAIKMFKFQTVFNPNTKEAIPLEGHIILYP